jgi:biopolymer transport protein ExbB
MDSAGRFRVRLATLLFCCLVAFFLTSAGMSGLQSIAQAQEPMPAEGGAEGGEGAPAEEPKPADSSHGGGSMFLHIIKSIGIGMGLVFLILSVSLVALVVLLAMDLRMGDSVPPAFVEEFTDVVNKRRFKEAFEMTRQDSSYLARVLNVGMARLQYGIDDAREAALNTVETIKANKEQFITYLATIGSLGPLIGLIGTVYSMVGAFMEMANSDHTDQKKMAGTLSHGLVVTMIGIGMAVPAMLCSAFFRNRLIKISNETANVADDLLTQMYHNSKKPAPTPAATANAAPAVAAIKPAE